MILDTASEKLSEKSKWGFWANILKNSAACILSNIDYSVMILPNSLAFFNLYKLFSEPFGYKLHTLYQLFTPSWINLLILLWLTSWDRPAIRPANNSIGFTKCLKFDSSWQQNNN